MLITGIMDAIGIASVIPFITLLLDGGSANSTIASFLIKKFPSVQDENVIFIVGIGVFLTYIIALTIKTITTYFSLKFSFYQQHLLSQKLLTNYIYQPYEWFVFKDNADIKKNILEEINTVIHGGLMPFLNLCASLAVSVALMIMLFMVDFATTLGLVAIFGMLYLCIFQTTKTYVKSIGLKRLSANEKRFRIVAEAFVSIKILKIHKLESFFADAFQGASTDFAKMNSTASIIAVLPRFFIEAIVFGGIVLIILILQSSDGLDAENIASLVVFMMAGYRLMPAIQQVYGNLSSVIFTSPTIQYIEQEIKVTSQAGERRLSSTKKKLSFTDRIAFRNVNFRYSDDETLAIDNFSETINAGTVVGIVGATGSGKSTLLDLLLGLIEPTNGKIEIDDVVFNKGNKRQWQRLIGFVPQEIHLYNGSVIENICFGSTDGPVDMHKVIECAKKACIHEFIENSLSDGYHTNLGQNGARLSGGQKQRICLARALYRDPKVLIMDEPTSALDNKTENMIMNAIYSLKNEVTIIMVAHRMATVKFCDKIIMLENGKISQTGDFDDLIRNSEAFRLLVD